ncbi:hypothetical protein BX666DRAFT_1103175 [Dichotomocladium elegans]|nr:hypothetical protein BX666DRAFT_1103175 [Dichotomocladium elegans]
MICSSITPGTNLYSQGMSTLNVLAELSMQDCTRLGVRSIDDKRKFMALADDIKQQLGARTHVMKRSAATTPPQPSRKRPQTTNSSTDRIHRDKQLRLPQKSHLDRETTEGYRTYLDMNIVPH